MREILTETETLIEIKTVKEIQRAEKNMTETLKVIEIEVVIETLKGTETGIDTDEVEVGTKIEKEIDTKIVTGTQVGAQRINTNPCRQDS